MKKQLVLASAIFCVIQVNAQSKFSKSKTNSDASKLMQSVLNAQLAKSSLGQKPTVIKQRVIAQNSMEIDEGDTYNDSTRYTYIGSKGSKYNYNQFLYNTEFDPYYAPMTLDFDNDGNPLNLLADSIRSYEDGELYATQKAFYRSDNKMDSIRTSYDLGEDAKIVVDYSASGVPISRLGKVTTDGGATYETFDSATYSYNGDFSKILESYAYYYDIVSINRYTYNAQNKMDTIFNTSTFSTFELVSRSIMDYYNDGRIRTILFQAFDAVSGEWKTESQDSVGYAPGQDYFAYWRQSHNFDNDMFYDVILNEQFPGANGLPDSAWISQLALNSSQWVKQQKFEYTYNTFNNPTKIKLWEYNTIGDLVDGGYANFYYEEYDDGVSVKNITNNNQFKTYPNPFQNKITIDWKGKSSKEKVVVKMINIVGQEVFKKEMTVNSGVNEIEIPEVNAGNYVLIIQDAEGKTYQDKLIKK